MPSSARRVLQAAGRPLRRVSRLIQVSNRGQRSSHANANNANFRQRGYDEYGSILEEDATVLSNSVGQSDNCSLLSASAAAQHHRFGVGGGSSTIVSQRNGGQHVHGDRDWVVYGLEGVLRHVLLLMGAYLLGVKCPQWQPYVVRVAEWVGVAWITCMVLLVMAFVQKHYYKDYPMEHQQQHQQRHATTSSYLRHGNVEEAVPLLNGGVGVMVSNRTSSRRGRDMMELEEDDDVEAPSLEKSSFGGPKTAVPVLPPTQHHPELEHLFIINTDNTERILPNACREPFKLDNDVFEGYMMVLIRTPDVDELEPGNTNDSAALLGTDDNMYASNYFRQRQRRFEFQWQIKVKKPPQGQRIFFSCELEEPVKMGMVQRAFVSAAMSFMKKMNNGFHYSFAGGPKSADGKYETPHMSFTVEGSMDRLVATKPGEPLPKLGEPILEDDASVKKRKKFGVDWNTEDTYTFALWSAYVDFTAWRCQNLPGIRPFDLSSVIGQQHINLTLYLIPPPEKGSPDKHYHCDKTTVANIEISNCRETNLGPSAKKWVTKNKPARSRSRSRSSEAGGPFRDDAGGGEQTEEEAELMFLSPTNSRDEEEDELFPEDDDQDWATVAELGEGIYLRSGGSVVLRESIEEEGEEVPDGNLGYLTNAGGFAVLQNQASSTIIIEKAKRPLVVAAERQTDSIRARSKLIKSGDTVMIKLVTKSKNDEQTDVKYLSVHRGWWLKWVSIFPTKNGYFSIHTHETEFDLKDGRPLPSSETQTSYLTLSGSFFLRHRRWSNYQVGVSVEDSPTFGGRMLGLFARNPDDEEDYTNIRLDGDDTEVGSKAKNKWMRPLHLYSQMATATNVGFQSPRITIDSNPPATPVRSVSYSSFDQPAFMPSPFLRKAHVDVPAWIETLHRTERRLIRVYVVRVMEEERDPFIRLRSGRDVADIMRLGLSWRTGTDFLGGSPKRRRSEGSLAGPSDYGLSTISSEKDSPTNDGTALQTTQPSLDMSQHEYSDNIDSPSASKEIDFDEIGSDGESSESCEDLSEGDYDDTDPDSGVNHIAHSTPNRPKKGRKLMGQIAKSVKAGTTKTGQKVRKGTVHAGKKIMAPISRGGVRSNKPPLREPKTKRSGRVRRRKKQRDHHEVVNRAMKSIGRRKSQQWLSQAPGVLAGQLCAPEQSCRMASHVLSNMSGLPSTSALSFRFLDMLSAQVASPANLDTWFLKGGAIELGVVPVKNDQSLLHECLVARCFWESHWREEWCGIYKTGVSLYAPLKKKPSLELPFDDVRSVRRLDPACGDSPLPGLPLLVIETAWRCHYMAFSGEESRDVFFEQINAAIFACSSGDSSTHDNSTQEQDLWKARFWQGFQADSVETGKWAKIASQSAKKHGKPKKMHRTVLNSRRMLFDVDPLPSTEEGDDAELKGASKFVEDLLTTALTFDLDSLEKDPRKFIAFLDATTQLKKLPLAEYDRGSPDAFCLFSNLYHCLLQHSLLLSVNGPLSKLSVGHFFRTSCYEVSGDVFSLAELYCCVIRGKMSRPVCRPYLEAPRSSNAPHRFFALDWTDPRSNFLLCTGDQASPQAVPVLRPDCLESQLNAASSAFVQSQLTVDVMNRVILLPKVCDVYRYDVGNGDPSSSLMYCLRFAKESDQDSIVDLLQHDANTVIKFQPPSVQYIFLLKLLA